MRQSYPYPIPADALLAFCRPDRAMHPLAKPCRGDGEVMAANGYVALRAHRGRWLDRDYAPAGAEFLERLGKIPWNRFLQVQDTDWRALDLVAAALWARGEIEPWLRGKMAPTPVWRVDEIPVRLSLLQLIARLPRCEVATGPATPDQPLFFRFTGGRGAIARDPRLEQTSFQIFAPARDAFDGERCSRPRGPKPSFSLPGWPPPEPVDD